MIGGKTYLQPFSMVMNAILDVGGLQKGEITYSDSTTGKVGFRIELYGEEIEYKFIVADTWSKCCVVTIELADEIINAQRLIKHEFALIDYILTNKIKIKITKQKE